MQSEKFLLYKRRLQAALLFVTSRKAQKAALRIATSHLHVTFGRARQSLPTLSQESFGFQEISVAMLPYPRRDGHLTHYELMILSALVQQTAPQQILEIGTFDGLSTLHLALNTSHSCTIHTLDLMHADGNFHDQKDLKYILDKDKHNKIYNNHPQTAKITEHYGNSLEYPFALFGSPDFIFIDGGHSYGVVKNDTEKALEILSDRGTILWHDYTPESPEVFTYLNKIGKNLPLTHIAETSFAIFTSKKKPQ